MEIIQTCHACPSQWDMEWNGIEYYVRYRYGWLEFSLAHDILNPLMEWQLGDSLDGVMTTEEMLAIIVPYLERGIG